MAEPAKLAKRLRLEQEGEEEPVLRGSSPLSLVSRISPPPTKKARLSERRTIPASEPAPAQQFVKSPFQLTKIHALPPHFNVDTVALEDILGDPLISECWEFNYLHDIDFLMNAFDEDVRHLVKINVIHGFWKKEEQSRIAMEVREPFLVMASLC
jgi:tyrosyl-DNA phosphodiesterase 1